MITLMVIRVTVINDCLLPHARHYARHFTHIFIMALGNFYYFLHFNDEETEVQ